MNTLVNFELAKSLNYKGLPGLKSFYDDKKHYELNPKKYTIAEVVMWLHEKYRIWISVCCTTIHNKISKFHFSITFIKDLSDERNYDGDLNKIKFNSPTEAYEAAIEYTLKNLI